jgi:hypothetical protein
MLRTRIRRRHFDRGVKVESAKFAGWIPAAATLF